MSAAMLALASCLVASVAASALGWLLASLMDSRLISPADRVRLWRAPLLLSAAAACAVLLAPHRASRPQPSTSALDGALYGATFGNAGALVHGLPIPPDAALACAAAVLIVVVAGGLWGLARVVRHVAMARRVSRKAQPAPAHAVRDLALTATRMGVAAPLLLTSKRIGVAALIGLLQPAIVIPVGLWRAVDRAGLQRICAHELAHLQRRDHWSALIDAVLAAVLWFDPFVRAAQRRAAAAREEACDAAILHQASPGDRRAYAATLVIALRLAAEPSFDPALIRRKGGGHLMRLNAILHPQTARPRTLSRAAVALSVVLAGGLSVAAGAAVAGRLPSTAPAAPGVRPGATAPSVTTNVSRSSITIMSDTVNVDKGVVTYTGHPTARWEGEAGMILLDGVRAPAGFTSDRLDSQRIKTIVVFQKGSPEAKARGAAGTVIDIRSGS